MKYLPKNQNIYVYKNNRIYIDSFKKGRERIRLSTGLKYSPLAMDFARKHYEDFCALEEVKKEYGNAEAKIRLKALQNKYYQIENKEVEKELNAYDFAFERLNKKKVGFEKGFERLELGKLRQKMQKLAKKFSEEEKLKKDLRETKYSFLSVSEAFLKEKSFLKDNTYTSYKIFMNKVLVFLHENKLYYLSDFKREHSVLFYEYFKAKGLSVSTLKLYCFFIKAIFNYALENDLLIKNPFFIPKTREKLEEKKGEFEVFSLEEVINLIKNAQGDLRTFLILAFFTGARTGELLALKWEDVDFEKNEIHIYKTLSTSGKIDSPKTKSSNRVIDMLSLVKSELETLKKEKMGIEKSFIVKSSRFSLKKAYDKLLESLHYKKRRLYDTRHSFASIMLSKGEEPLWVGCKMLGHKDLNETYRTYAKYLPKPVVQRAGFLSELDFERVSNI